MGTRRDSRSSRSVGRQSGLLLRRTLLNKAHSSSISTIQSKVLDFKILNEAMNTPQGEVKPMETTSQSNQDSKELTRLFHQTKKTLPVLSYKDMSDESVNPVLNTLIGYEPAHESPHVFYQRCEGCNSQLD